MVRVLLLAIKNTYLNGSRTPTGKNVDQLAGVLGMEVYDLLGLARPY